MRLTCARGTARLLASGVNPCNPLYSNNFLMQVQTTLSVVEEERDRFMAKLLSEEKSRKSLEGDLKTEV